MKQIVFKGLEMAALSQAMIALKQILERPRNFAVPKLIISAASLSEKNNSTFNLMERCCFVI
ncbi:hypothetical protein BAXH7_04135 [Bacillus amyloliquefaciens XH7]|nr:hypothetical protein BAMTA208_20150 [Bacillus amyloliquefaciens TA208]AEK91241.1 hypothetical protein BAXH7_04135 [Bacillus amyloliquefaciens XH7]QDP94159.1 hypothetical protein FOG69_19470 [Bacillus amyloliquefaciens]